MKKIKILASGFTLFELLVALAIIGILLAIAIPSFRALQTEVNIARAQGDLNTLKVAIESYYKNKGSFPLTPNSNPCTTWQYQLVSASPRIINTVLYDPLNPTTNTEYQYYLADGGRYYTLYSVGPNATPYNLSNKFISCSSTGSLYIWDPSVIWVSNIR
jgi:prepilin-type N-terminal cleavage/methylation domain-containing protein